MLNVVFDSIQLTQQLLHRLKRVLCTTRRQRQHTEVQHLNLRVIHMFKQVCNTMEGHVIVYQNEKPDSVYRDLQWPNR